MAAKIVLHLMCAHNVSTCTFFKTQQVRSNAVVAHSIVLAVQKDKYVCSAVMDSLIIILPVLKIAEIQ